MAPSGRDDFTAAVKRTLAERVGHCCSNPTCRAHTSGPQVDASKALNVGVAAHITAAAPGGPRYDASRSAEQRADPSNGIWLCQTCAKLVDNDPTRFSASLLHEWKTEAERSQLDRIGRASEARVVVGDKGVSTAYVDRVIHPGFSGGSKC